jgi:hypothetical protein
MNRKPIPRLQLNKLEHIVVHKVTLCQHHYPALYIKQPAYIKMLARLRHHAFISRDHKHYQVDAASAREHVFDKALMAGHVDKAKSHVARFQLSKTKVDRYSAFFFFRQAVGIRTGQRFYERRFSVIYVPGRADNDVHIFTELSSIRQETEAGKPREKNLLRRAMNK